ncbi:BNR repeat-containing family member [Cyclobacterium lianum]|uniref:BNR repeat-containing family member n=1 Tax=Cyclobacterium lianum TaxID=388280 RepID=A0A1M7LCU1_9BACT|nr:BNR-4 repeat-containing protein [Cyclobacterium lianum]SHM75706.1 BNR repeat-containing family member [Cyclobacterium lianum]
MIQDLMKHLTRLILSNLIFILFSFGQPTVAQEKFPAVDGYKGIWFTLGQFSEFGDKYSGGLGTYTAKHIPLAIHAPEVNRTFFVYGGTRSEGEKHLLCMIGMFDHETGLVSKPVIVHDKLGVDDPHDNPSLSIDDAGHIWVFVSGRGRRRMGFKYRSREPYSISDFEQISEEEMTYPQPKYINGSGFLNLFTKYTGVRELYFETSADGMNWSEDRKLVAIIRNGDTNSGHYQISGQSGNKIGFFCNWHPNGNVDLRTNLYYFQSVDFGETWTDVEGNKVEIPVVNLTSSGLVREYFSQKRNVYLKDVNFDADGNPIALYVEGIGHHPGPENGSRKWHVVHWNGAAWEDHVITESDQNYDMGSLWVSGNDWMVIGPTSNSPQEWGAGGEVEMWKSSDGGAHWVKTKSLTRRSERNHNYIRRVVNGQDPFYYFWADGNPDKFSRSQLYFGDSSGKVWMLPYEMDRSAVKPKRLRNSWFSGWF